MDKRKKLTKEEKKELVLKELDRMILEVAYEASRVKMKRTFIEDNLEKIHLYKAIKSIVKAL